MRVKFQILLALDLKESMVASTTFSVCSPPLGLSRIEEISKNAEDRQVATEEGLDLWYPNHCSNHPKEITNCPREHFGEIFLKIKILHTSFPLSVDSKLPIHLEFTRKAPFQWLMTTYFLEKENLINATLLQQKKIKENLSKEIAPAIKITPLISIVIAYDDLISRIFHKNFFTQPGKEILWIKEEIFNWFTIHIVTIEEETLARRAAEKSKGLWDEIWA